MDIGYYYLNKMRRDVKLMLVTHITIRWNLLAICSRTLGSKYHLGYRKFFIYEVVLDQCAIVFDHFNQKIIKIDLLRIEYV